MDTQFVAKFTKEIFKSQGKEFPKARQMEVSKEELLKIVDNFWSGANGYGIGPDGESRTYVPLYGHDNEGPNAGYVTELEYKEETNSLWATIGILKNDVAQDIDSRAIPDNSIMFGRMKDRKEMGRYLVHVALVNDPLIIDLAPFERVSNDGIIMETICCSNLSPFKEVSNMAEEIKEVEEEVAEIAEAANAVTADTETESEEELATKSVLQAFIDKHGKAKLYEVLKKAQKEIDDKEEEESKASTDIVKKSEGLASRVKKMFGVDAESKDLKASLRAERDSVSKLEAALNKANEVMELALKEKDEELSTQKEREWEMLFDGYLEAKMTVPAEKEFLAAKFPIVDELKDYLDGRGIEFDLHTESIVANKDREMEEDAVLTKEDFAYLRGERWLDENNKPVNERCKKVVAAYRERTKQKKEKEMENQ